MAGPKPCATTQPVAQAFRPAFGGVARAKAVWGSRRAGGPRRGERGLSLVEASIIVMVLSILSAVLAPAIGAYIGDSRHAKAKADVEVIGTAVMKMLGDIGEAWVQRDGNGAASTDPPSHAAANRVDLLVTDGATPTVNLARSVGSPDWNAAVDNAGVQKLEHHLVLNTPSNVAANGYRTASNMSVLGNFDPDSGAQFNAEHAWRGAYLASPVGTDPWGNRYAVNVEFLAKALGAGPSGNVNDVFVLCAGPNGATDTRFDTDGATALGNDILYLVGGGTR